MAFKHIFTFAAISSAACTMFMPSYAHAITYDSNQDEYFETIEDFMGAGTENVGIRFGTTLQESLRFNRSTNMFETSRGLEVNGTLSGQSLRVDDSVAIGTESPSNARVHVKNGGAGQKFRIETNASPYSLYFGGGINGGVQDEAGINFGARLSTYAADTTSTAWGIEASGDNDYFAIKRGANNGQGSAVTWSQLFRIDSNGDVGIGMGSANAKTKLEVSGTISGSTLHASTELTSSGNLVTEGRSTLNGVTVLNEDASSTSHVRMEGGSEQNLFFLNAGTDRIGIGTSSPKAMLDVLGALSGATFFGAGLTDCSNATNDKLLYNATTGKFSCGTDQSGGGSSGGGMTYAAAEGMFVNQGGDTMTGSLNIDLANTTNGTGLSVAEHAEFGSGATLSGHLILRAVDNPSAPEDNYFNLYARKVGGRTLLKGMGPSGVDYAYQPSFFQNMIVMINTNNTTSVNAFGNTVTSAGTLSHPTATETYGWMTNFATAGTANSTAGTGNNGTLWFRGSTAGANGFFYNARLAYPDASYGAGATGARTYAGLTNQTMATMVGSDNPAGHYAGFQFSTNRGDTNWQFVTKDNTTQNVVNTGLTFSAQKVYDVFIFCKPQCTSIGWRINNVTDGTMAEGSTSSNLPGATTAMRGGFQLSTLTTTARNIRMQRVYIEADR